MRGVVALLRIRRRVVRRALGDPAADQGQIGLRERRFLRRHLGLALLGRDLFQEQRVLRVFGNDRVPAVGDALATVEQLCEIRHHVPALRFCGLMAALAVRLKNRADFFEVADRRVRILVALFRGCRAESRGGRSEQGEGESGAGFHVSEMTGESARFLEGVTKARLRGKHGGRGGIRTHGAFNSTFDFESSALNRTQPPFRFGAAIMCGTTMAARGISHFGRGKACGGIRAAHPATTG